MQKSIAHQGCQLSYSVEGSGESVLFIQGVGVHGFGWQPQTDEISKSFHCIRFDNRGMGKSQPVERELSVDLMAEDALAILDAERIEGAHVVGHSLGGLVAIQLALLQPQRISSLSLLCTFPSGRMAAPLTMRMIYLGMRSQIGTRAMRRRGFMRLIYPPGPIEAMDEQAKKLAELFGHDLGDQPTIVKEQLRAMKRSDCESELPKLSSIPTLIMSAFHDPIAPPKAGKFMRDAINGSRYFEVPNASHGLPITHAPLVNQHLLEHFAAMKELR